MKTLPKYIKAFGSLFFPRLCVSCSNVLYSQEKCICTHCLAHLPLTHFTNEPGNKVEELFYGLVPCKNATALFYYEKGSRYQKLIHRFKYHHETDVGTVLGMYLGNELNNSRFSEIDAIVPVPLHKNKFAKRGFNQSEIIAEGVSRNFKKPIYSAVVERIADTRTQTHRTRFDRSQNVQNIFQVADVQKITGQHLLLIDDVVTTGATLESLAHILLEAPGVKISIATLGYANR